MNPILQEWLAEIIKQGRYADAIKFNKHILLANPLGDATAQANILSEQEEYDRSIEILDEALEGCDGTVASDEILDAKASLAFACARSGKHKRALKEYGDCYQEMPGVDSIAYAYASCLAVSGNLNRASSIFSKEIDIACGNGENTNTRILNISLAGQPNLTPHGGQGSVDFIDLPAGNGGMVYLVGCDANYLSLFGAHLATAISKYGDQVIELHFHIIGTRRQKKIQKVIQNISQIYNNTTYSFGVLPSTISSKTSQKSYYSVCRYFALRAIRDRIDIPILVADIDQIPLKNPMDILNDYPIKDIALLYDNQSTANIFSLHSATVSLFTASESSKKFIEQLVAYITTMIRRGDEYMLWHLDQAALAMVALAGDSVDCVRLPSNIVAANVVNFTREELRADGYIFWSITASVNPSADRLNDIALTQKKRPATLNKVSGEKSL